MRTGKLDNETLKRLVLGRVGANREEVLMGAGVGEDCAALDFGDFECVVSTDPITASAKRVGSLAVYISCNDVASNGVEPLAVLLTILLPVSITEEEIDEIARQADEAAKAIGVQIVGGHTEVTEVVSQPLVSATAIGRASAGHLKAVSGALSPGDLIVVTKQLAIEGTAIAAERRERDLRTSLTEDELDAARAMIDQISVVREGVAAGRVGVGAMHDVTEGGALGAVWEVCARAGVGAEILAGALPFEAVTLKICAALELDPMRLISSGSMLMVVSEEKRGALFAALEAAGVRASVIGRVTAPEENIVLVLKDGSRETILPPAADEIYKI